MKRFVTFVAELVIFLTGVMLGVAATVKLAELIVDDPDRNGNGKLYENDDIRVDAMSADGERTAIAAVTFKN